MRISAAYKVSDHPNEVMYSATFMDMGPRGDEPHVHLDLQMNRATGRLDRVEALSILAREPGQAPITAEYLRALADSLDALVGTAAHAAGSPLDMRLDAIAASGKKGERLVEVVEAYLDAIREGLPPFATSQERLAMSRATVARYVAEARRLELLPPKGTKADKGER